MRKALMPLQTLGFSGLNAKAHFLSYTTKLATKFEGKFHLLSYTTKLATKLATKFEGKFHLLSYTTKLATKFEGKFHLEKIPRTSGKGHRKT